MKLEGTGSLSEEEKWKKRMREMEAESPILHEMDLRIRRAKHHPMKPGRYEEIGLELQEILDRDVAGSEMPGDEERMKELEEETKESAALAYNLTEFRIMLEALRMYYPGLETGDILAHENAHANVLEKEGFEFNAYGFLFIENPNTPFPSLQPVVFYEGDKSWEPLELAQKHQKVIEAPELYENSLSPLDQRDSIRNQKRLGELEKPKE